MKVLYQKNIWDEYNYDRFIKSLQENGFDLQEVNIIPFTDQFQEDVKLKNIDYVFGSTRFCRLCREKGLPVFKNFDPIENFYYDQYWMNGDGYSCKLGDIKLDGTPLFLKPFTEKFFTGCLVEKEGDLDKIQLCTSFIENEYNELVWVSSPKNIYNEIRFFIIGEQIITASYYKEKGQKKQYRIDETHEAWDTCKRILHSNGYIDDAFVIDLGYNGEMWKIVELNNFNSSGLYETNTDAIARALFYL